MTTNFYLRHFKNTFFVDILEYSKILKIDEYHNDGYHDIEEKLVREVDMSNTKSLTEQSEIEKDSVQKSDSASTIDPFLVDWCGEEDPDKPTNWANWKKSIIIVLTMLLSCITYMGSSIFVPGQDEIQEEFGSGHVVTTLNLSLYALGYGIGPVIFSPLSEVAKLGRQQIYIVTFFMFTMFQIGCATAPNIGGLIVMRFITGIVCSPSLSTGGATVADTITMKYLPICLAIWDMGATCAPIFAPLFGAVMTVAKDWRWIFWFLLFLSATLLVILIFFYPETSHENILSRRARRLREQTGDNRYYTKQERIDSEMTTKNFIITTCYRPLKLIVNEPIVLAFDLYISLAYGAFYLFFEAFPFVFNGIYHFTLIETGLSYMGFMVGAFISFPILFIFLHTIVNPRVKNNTFTPETYLILAQWVGWCLPFSLFLFGWGAGTHWITPIIAEVFFLICVWNLFQVTYSYLALCYPKYVASVYAGNGLLRAIFACIFPLFAQALYKNLGSEKYPVGWGSSLIGFFTIGLTFVPFVLYKYGATLRAKSKYCQ